MPGSLSIVVALALHQLATLVWVGGMFFAQLALGPAARARLERAERLRLLSAVFDRFFVWAWIAILLLWGSGGWILWQGQRINAGPPLILMIGIAAAMSLLFAFLYWRPYRALRDALAENDLQAATARLRLVRALIAANLVLGLSTALLGAVGRFL